MSAAAPAAPASPGGGALAPFVHRVFLALWLASLASNLGTWMHGVGASWLVTSLTTSATAVALVQTASALPTFLLALPAGALADVLDRRKLLIGAQIWMALVAAAFCVLTALDLVSVPVVLALTSLLGIGAALNQPAWSAIVPELVPRADLPQALVLNGMAFTGAQAVGPAIGGAIVAASGPAAVFGLNAVSFVGQIVVLWRWQRPAREEGLPVEHVRSAIGAGLRYVRFAPALQIVLARAAVYVVGFSALVALIPVLARGPLGLGPGGFGILLGCMGLGAVAGGPLLPVLRRRVALDPIVAGASAVVGCVLVVLGIATVPAVAFPGLVVFGLAQMSVMSSLNLAAQNALPGWVRGRGLALYTLVFQAAMALGALGWGVLAGIAGTGPTLIAAGGLLVASAVLGRVLPLAAAADADMTTGRWPEPQVVCVPEPDDGPILVTAEYMIDREDRDAFLAAMERLRRVRRRDGALRWGLWHDLTQPGRHVETYIVASWAEHLRQRERSTAADRDAWRAAREHHRGEDGVVVRWHLLRRVR